MQQLRIILILSSPFVLHILFDSTRAETAARRLYKLKPTASKIEKTGDITPFKYFYLFFRLEAFPKVPLGSSFLDRVREESTAYAQKIGKDLQENVYKAMKDLAEGRDIEHTITF